MRVLEPGAYDVVLDIYWLECFSPMDCHWLHKTMAFDYEGRRVSGPENINPDLLCILNQSYDP